MRFAQAFSFDFGTSCRNQPRHLWQVFVENLSCSVSPREASLNGLTFPPAGRNPHFFEMGIYKKKASFRETFLKNGDFSVNLYLTKISHETRTDLSVLIR